MSIIVCFINQPNQSINIFVQKQKNHNSLAYNKTHRHANMWLVNIFKRKKQVRKDATFARRLYENDLRGAASARSGAAAAAAAARSGVAAAAFVYDDVLLLPATQMPTPTPIVSYVCTVCDTTFAEHAVKLACGHGKDYCLQCLEADAKVELGMAKAPSCMTCRQDCSKVPTMLSDADVRAISPQLLARFQDFKALAVGWAFKCRRVRECGGLVTVESDRCPTCSTSHCLTCRTLAHATTSCRENQRAALASVVSHLDAIVSEDTKACPNCLTLIQRESGCNSMRCIECGCGFCWLCGTVTADVEDALNGWTRDMMHAHYSPNGTYEIRQVVPAMKLKVILRQMKECILGLFSRSNDKNYRYPGPSGLIKCMFTNDEVS